MGTISFQPNFPPNVTWMAKYMTNERNNRDGINCYKAGLKFSDEIGQNYISESPWLKNQTILSKKKSLPSEGTWPSEVFLIFLALSWFPFCHSLGWRMMGSKYRNGALSLSGKKWHGTCRRKSWLKKYLYLNMYEIYIWKYRNGALAKKWHWELQKKILIRFPPDGNGTDLQILQ